MKHNTYIKFIVLVFAINSFLYCSKVKIKSTTLPDELELLASGNPPAPDDSLRNFVVLKLDQTLNAYDTINSYDINSYGEFRDDNGNRVNVGNISIKGQTMAPNSSNYYQLPFTGPLLNIGKTFFGNQVQVAIPGNGYYPAMFKTIYVPNA